MFTICPKCALTLVVTAADLRVAQGYVRCGRCSSVFNALARLTDDRQGAGAAGEAGEADEAAEDVSEAAEPDSSARTPAAARSETDADDESISEEALEFNPATTDVEAVFVDPPPNPQWTAATGSFKAMIAANQEAEPSEPPDAQVDVEIDAAFLGTILRGDPTEAAREGARSAPQPPGPASAGGAPTPAAPPPTPPAASSTPQASRAAPATRESPAATAAAARTAPPAHSPAATRHAAPHARPSVEAAVRPAHAVAAARSRTAPAPRREVPRRAPQREVSPRAQQRELSTRAPQRAADEADELTLEEESAPAAAPDDSESPTILARLAPLRWHIGAAVALLLLVVQVLNHYRDELAATARFNHPLTALYSFLGVQLAPHWDLRAYDVRQLGASVDAAAAGLITVRASIKNAASQPQPLPLLRVTLQDRFGNRIAARDVDPRFYLPHDMPASSFLSGGQRIDAEMAFVDPGANAVGFEVDACLPASGGGVTCANDVSAR
jgi:predicted Zn finger-like uncharacterized protein